MTTNKRFELQLPDDEKRRLDDASDVLKTPKARIIRTALTEHLDAEQAKHKAAGRDSVARALRRR